MLNVYIYDYTVDIYSVSSSIVFQYEMFDRQLTVSFIVVTT